MGQGYGDLEEFDHDRFLDSIFKDKVYDKTEKIQALGEVLSVDNSQKDEPTIDVPDMTPQLDTPKLESSSGDADKIVEKVEEQKELTVPQTMEMGQAQIDDVKFSEGDNVVTEEKIESVADISEPKPKGGSFFRKIFKDNKDKKDADKGKDNRNDETESKKEPNKKENKNKYKSKSKPESEREDKVDDDDVVYLTDDDINDLIK